MRSLLIITSPSAWGKTTLKNELVENRGWKSAINFTTRQPRSEREKDDYVFIDKETFFKKLRNGDFLEHTSYQGEEYAVSRFLPKGNVVMVLDPIGRNQVMSKWAAEGLKVNTVYLEISPEEQRRRLEARVWVSVNDIRGRQKDFRWFDRTKFCLEIDWTRSVIDIADIVEDSLSI